MQSAILSITSFSLMMDSLLKNCHLTREDCTVKYGSGLSSWYPMTMSCIYDLPLSAFTFTKTPLVEHDCWPLICRMTASMYIFCKPWNAQAIVFVGDEVVTGFLPRYTAPQQLKVGSSWRGLPLLCSTCVVSLLCWQQIITSIGQDY